MPMGKRTNIFAALLCAFFLAVSASGTRAEEPSFVSGIDDLPLMPGLTMADDGNVEFESPQGRLVEARAYGTLKPAVVSTFYNRVLPELGWHAIDAQTFAREKEVLKITFPDDEEDQSRLTVRFSLSPGQ